MNSQRSAPVPAKGQPGLLQRARHWLSGKKEYAQGGSVTSFSLTDLDILQKIFGRGTYTGRAVTDDYAMAVSTVWRCVQLLSQAVGSLPWAVYERVGPTNAREAQDHPLSDILTVSPNADMDRMQFREAMTANLALRGNAYALKELRGDGNVSSLYPIPSINVTPRRNALTQEVEYVVTDRGQQIVYPRDKIWHVRLFGFNGLVGMSPLGYGRHAMALAGAAEEYGSRFFSNGARISGTVKIPQWLEDDQRAKAKKNLAEMHSGMENAHKLFLLEGGMEYEQTSATPNEAQFTELRRFQIPDICRFFGVPPHLAFDMERATFSSVEALATEFVMFGLLPHLVRFETAAQRQLLKPADRRKFFVRFNFEGLLRANSLERSQFYAAMLQNGVLSRNEVREKENLNRSEEAGMDDRTVQTNLAFVQFLEAMVKTGSGTGRGNGDPNPTDPAPAKGINVFNSPPSIFNFPPDIRIPDFKAGVTIQGLDQIIKQLGERKDADPALIKALEAVKASVDRPRKAVFDKSGNPIGTVPVDEIEGS